MLHYIKNLLKKIPFLYRAVRRYKSINFLRSHSLYQLFDPKKIYLNENSFFFYKNTKLNKFVSNDKYKKNFFKKYQISFKYKQLKNINIYNGYFVDNGKYVFYSKTEINIFKEILPEEYTGEIIIRSEDCYALKKLKRVKIFDRCIVFTNISHDNYAHFFFETLPAVAWFSQQKKYSNYTFVFNKFKHINFYKLIEIFNIKNTFFLEKNCKIFAKTGIIFSPVCSIIHNPRMLTLEKNFSHFGKFNHRMIDYMVKIISKKFFKYTDTQYHNIYYKRSSLLRVMDNNKNFEKYLTNKKFKFISGYDSLPEQISYLRKAKNIIVCNGSEIANLIFANKNANIYLISSYNRYSMPSFWINFLAKRFKKLKVFYVKLNTDDIHAPFKINLEDLDKFIRFD